MEQKEEDLAKGGDVKKQENVAIQTILPVCISDKALLVAEELTLPSPKPPSRIKSLKVSTGHTTWLLAAVALPTIGILLLLTLLLVAEPLDNHHRLGVNDAAFWKGRWRKSQTPRRNIFIVDINSETFPSAQKLSALESCLKQNKYDEIYQLTLNQYIDQPKNATALRRLKKKYNNLHFYYQNAPSHFRGSIFADAINDSPSLMLFKAQLLMLWRYGGLVLSSNWTCLKPLDKLYAKDDKTVVVGSNEGQLVVMSVHNTCNAKLFDVMREVNKLKGGISNLEVIERVSLKSKSGFKYVNTPQLCVNNTVTTQCMAINNTPPVRIVLKKSFPSEFTRNLPVKTFMPIIRNINPQFRQPDDKYSYVSERNENFDRQSDTPQLISPPDTQIHYFNVMPKLVRRFLFFP